MSVALLLITHDTIGSSFFSTVVTMMGVSPITTKNLSITQKMNVEQGIAEANKLCHELDKGEGVLILTDILDSTLSSIATRLLENISDGSRIIVTGINLPMLVRVMNYAGLSLPELAKKACSCSHDSIFISVPSID